MDKFIIRCVVITKYLFACKMRLKHKTNDSWKCLELTMSGDQVPTGYSIPIGVCSRLGLC